MIAPERLDSKTLEELYMESNPALARLLKTLNTKGPVATVKLLELLRSDNYGQKTLRKAERLGYVKRYQSKPVKHQVGKPPVMNELTVAGKRLASIRTKSSK